MTVGNSYLLRQGGKGLGAMLADPVRVTGMEEEPLNKSCGRGGNIAGINCTAFLSPSTAAFLLMLPFEKSSFTCAGFQPCSAS